MKLAALLFGVVVLAFAAGCGPGLGHHGKWAQAPTDSVSTTHVTGGAFVRPAPIIPAVRWDDDELDPPKQTWGTPPEQDPAAAGKYGF
jgi:hypothetical protein